MTHIPRERGIFIIASEPANPAPRAYARGLLWCGMKAYFHLGRVTQFQAPRQRLYLFRDLCFFGQEIFYENASGRGQRHR